MSGIRERAKQAAKKQTTQQLKKLPPKREPPAPPPVKAPPKPRPRWMTCALWTAVVGVTLVGIGMVISYKVNQAFGGLSGDQLVGEVDLSVYCDSIEAPLPDCDAWAARIVQEDWIGADICLDHYDWIAETTGFTMCLIGLGIAPIPGQEAMVDLHTGDWTSADYDVIAMLSRFCDGTRNKDYCVAWSMVTYRDNRNAIWGCAQSKPDQVGFTQCIQGLGIAA